MRITKSISQYTQKSRLFLYPTLGIPRGHSFIPVQTYLSWSNHYTIEQHRLLCLYKTKKTKAFKHFEQTVLFNHSYFEKRISVDDRQSMYVFDLTALAQDYDFIIKGRYSQLSSAVKNEILSFFINEPGHKAIINSYLNPEPYFEVYSELLEVDINILRETGELSNPPNLEREHFDL